MAIREGRWDCSSCGKVANLGRDLRCSGCGQPRGKVKFYLPPNEPAVVEAERLAQAKAGPDWVCAYCAASNRSTSAACTGCGAPRADGAARTKGDATEKTAADHERESQEQANREMAAEYGRKVAASRRKQMIGLASCAAIFVFLCSGVLGLGMFNARSGGTKGIGGPSIRVGAPSGGSAVTILSKSATRKVAVEANSLVTENGWCRQQPSGAQELTRVSKQNGTRCVSSAPAHGGGPLLAILLQEDMGNGYFEDSSSSGSSSSSSGNDGNSSSCTRVAVYEDYCTWQVWKWIVVREPLNSDSDVPPPWPIVTLKAGEREGARTEVFEVEVKSADGEQISLPVDGARWMTWKQGQEVPARWSFFGGLKSVGS